MGSFITLDLQAFFNNRGCTHLDEKHLGNLSLGGGSLPSEELSFGEPLVIDGVPFVCNQNEAGDNIECAEQTITFPPHRVKRLHVLGTSSNTDLFDYISFLYEGAVIHRDRFYLSGFSSTQSAFSDHLALVFSCLHTRAGRYEHLKPHVWYYTLVLPQLLSVDSLRFEDNPSMHVFALTIEDQ